MGYHIIEPKGITRSLSKNVIVDGQSDDIVNLRLKNGSWRVTSEGKLINISTLGYTQLHVHTNVYHNLLGVKNGKLWWFANISNDGETFTPLTTPVEICEVQGEIEITQNGHLLTIVPITYPDINKAYVKYSIFKSDVNEYKSIDVEANGLSSSRSLFPFGEVHFNLHRDESKTLHKFTEVALDMTSDANSPFNGLYDKDYGKVNAEFTRDYCRNTAKSMFGEQTSKNIFTRPFLACVAIKLYDGSYAYASPITLLYPNEMANAMDSMYGQKYLGKSITPPTGVEEQSTYNDMMWFDPSITKVPNTPFPLDDYVCVPSARLTFEGGKSIKKVHYTSFVASDISSANTTGKSEVYKATNPPIFCAGAHIDDELTGSIYPSFQLLGFDLSVSINNFNILSSNPDIFKSLCIFVTPQVDIYEFGEGDVQGEKWIKPFDFYEYYAPKKRSIDKITHDLLHSPMFLLKEYTNIGELVNNPIVDLSLPEDIGVLESLSTRDVLSSETIDRRTILPKVVYEYNQKLHFANYCSVQFHGFPLDLFHMNNHSVAYMSGNYYEGVLENLKGDNPYIQYPKRKVYFAETSQSHHNSSEIALYVTEAQKRSTMFASVTTYLDTQQGEQKVVRYIAPFDSDYLNADGRPTSFIESVGPLLTFPDFRAKRMVVEVVNLYENRITKHYETFNLKAHPYLNIAYYIDSELKPIDIRKFKTTSISKSDFENGYSNIADFFIPLEYNNIEVYPNGLKVSLANNPFVFPNESTYQVGSAEIVALMSNAVAIGTGQTGAAPLYVFCKDGIYALIVDGSGQTTYSNARIIARDVCNNHRSVTPIDEGVIFTTDRGIMNISGEKVLEIGDIAEGDVFDITDTTDKAKNIMFNAFTYTEIANISASLLDNEDFLTFLKGSIVNYNHNEKELMVSNPNKPYTYIMDREGNWSRRDFSAVEYIHNYPTSYRVDQNGYIYKVDEEGISKGKFFYLSNVIKLGSTSFKQGARLIARGLFDVEGVKVARGSINGVIVYAVGSFVDEMVRGTVANLRYITLYGMNTWVDVDNSNRVLYGALKIYDATTGEDITDTVEVVNSGIVHTLVLSSDILACYVFGSHDGRQWSILGGNEKSGTFTDIGCDIAHNDVKFLRLCLAGKLSQKSRLDFIEISTIDSVLNSKLR